MSYGDVCALVGGQFGSEGKGLIAGHIAQEYGHHVRVGAANAGHTLYTIHDYALVKHVMQQLPCAAYANPDAQLYVGPGAIISSEILEREIEELHAWRKAMGHDPINVHIDYRAHVVRKIDILNEAESGLDARIGSTSTIAREGIGAAMAARVMREADCVTAGAWQREIRTPGIDICDVPEMLSRVSGILLEGTQGTGLSLTTGFFPFVTSRNTTAAGLLADSGVAPTRLGRVIMVCRTYPIRVAGPSGPFHWGSDETDWEALGVDSQTERTTVTKRVRRVATLSMAQIIEATYLNGATDIALTFCDYLEPEIYGATGVIPFEDLSTGPIVDLVEKIESDTGVPVRYLGTSPHDVIDMGNVR